ncbi:MAG: hypothetical protein WCA20_05060 [Candidatus Sulfotelmatobacter sp.]
MKTPALVSCVALALILTAPWLSAQPDGQAPPEIMVDVQHQTPESLWDIPQSRKESPHVGLACTVHKKADTTINVVPVSKAQAFFAVRFNPSLETHV